MIERTFRVVGIIVVLAAGLLGLSSCSHASYNMHQTLRSNFQAPNMLPRLLAVYQPWFGDAGHINVGYSSHDPVEIRRQIEEAQSLGISGFVVNWYGPRKEFMDQTYAMVQQAAIEKNFQVAIQYDEPVDNPANTTDDVISDLQYAHEHYISPDAGPSQAAYLRYQGRPVIFIFPKSNRTDWNKVRNFTNSWVDPPLLIYKDINTRAPQDFDGFYAWVQPDDGKWQSNGKNWGEHYLDYFYSTMKSNYPDKIAVGAAWPGFNDSKASWSLNRHISARCGQTFEDSLRVFRRYYTDRDPLPFLLIVTWNDYEEGTAIERGTGVCEGGKTVNRASTAYGQAGQ
jgi:hypothetical protein